MSRKAMQLALEALESDPISHAGPVTKHRVRIGTLLLGCLVTKLLNASLPLSPRMNARRVRRFVMCLLYILNMRQTLQRWPRKQSEQGGRNER